MNKSTKIIIAIIIFIIVAIVYAFKSSTPTASFVPLTSTTTDSSNLGAAVENTLQATSSAPTVDKTYTPDEVSLHSTATDCWTAIGDSVYDLTSFIPNHPGGDRILVICGKDGTKAFMDQHGGKKKQENILTTLKIGKLAK